MVIAIDTTSTYDYVLEEDRKRIDTEKTIFKVRVLTKGGLLVFNRRVVALQQVQRSEDVDKVTESSDELSAILNEYIPDWENFKNGEGNLILHCDTKDSRWDDYFSLKTVNELLNCIVTVNSLGIEEEKN